MKKILLSLVFLLNINLAFSENLNLYIKYLGIKMVNVNMTDLDNKIIIKAKSVGIAGLAGKMDNTYISHYDRDYLPTNYTKYIKQKDYFENRSTDYFRDINLAIRTELFSSDKAIEYEINALSRDFFSALFYLRKIKDLSSGSIWLDANKSIWKAHYKLMGNDTIKTILGRKNTILVKFSFEKISNLQKENTDMLTNNLVDENKHLLFWFTDDEKRIPLRAEFNMKPFPVVWELENYEE